MRRPAGALFRGDPSHFDAAVARGRRNGERAARVLRRGLVALLVMSFCGGVVTFVYLGFVADASLYVFHTRGTATVSIDGRTVATLDTPSGPYPARDVRVLRVPRGPHQLAIEHDGVVRTWAIDFNGLDDLLVPTDPATCVASVEVSRALYREDGELIPPLSDDACAFEDASARMTCTPHTQFPYDFGSAHVRLEDLPDTVGDNRLTFLLVPFECADAATVDGPAVMRRYLGCEP